MRKEILQAIVAGGALTADDVEACVAAIMDGETTPAQAAAFLTALRMRGETADEIALFAKAMRARSVTVATTRAPLVDTCGTGGDSLKTFNISTAAAFVAAAAGVGVAKHGNRAVTSKSGSADVLEALGVRLDLSAEAVGRCIDEIGIGFLFARNHHPAMKHVAPVRAELGFRTIFNLLGPLTNPAGAQCQVIGVFESQWCEPLACALRSLGASRALVVHGVVGLDEISTCGPTVVAELSEGGEIRVYEITPGELGVERASPESLAGAETPAGNAEILRAVLGGESGPRADIVAVNAAAALYVAGVAPTLKDGARRASGILKSGAALRVLENLIAFR